MGKFALSQAPDVPERPMIQPLREGGPRPFWSVMVPIYNCPPHYLRETLQSVLRQDPGPAEMQIEVIDNCSTTGNPEAVVREVGGGRIAFRQQPKNVGLVGNFNDCIRHATGHWVHILHGDDSVRPGFYERLRAGIAACPDVGAAFSRLLYMDEHSHWTGLPEVEARAPGRLQEDFVHRLLLNQGSIQFVSIIVRRTVYEELGGFLPVFNHCVDWDMWKRIALSKWIHYEPEPLACFRVHSGSDGSRVMRTGENVVEERMSIELSCAGLPAGRRQGIRSEALKVAGVRAARRAWQAWNRGDRRMAWSQFREAHRCSLAPAVTARLSYFLLRTMVR